MDGRRAGEIWTPRSCRCEGATPLKKKDGLASSCIRPQGVCEEPDSGWHDLLVCPSRRGCQRCKLRGQRLCNDIRLISSTHTLPANQHLRQKGLHRRVVTNHSDVNPTTSGIGQRNAGHCRFFRCTTSPVKPNIQPSNGLAAGPKLYTCLAQRNLQGDLAISPSMSVIPPSVHDHCLFMVRRIRKNGVQRMGMEGGKKTKYC